MTTLRVRLDVKCSQCGSDMQHSMMQDGERNIWIAPCLTCLNRANDAGFEDGHDKGWKEAKHEAAV